MLDGRTMGIGSENTSFVEYSGPEMAAGLGVDAAALGFPRLEPERPSAGPADLDLAILVPALEALPLPAALIRATGETLCANRRLLQLLGLGRGSRFQAIRLPLPEAGAARGARRRQDVRAGRLRVTRADGLILNALVVAVGLGDERGLLYLLADVEEPEATIDARPAADPPALDPASKLASLTFRERHVLRLLIAGGSNKGVARELGISPRTVEVHRSRILHKLGARSLTQAFAVAMAAGLDAQTAAPAAGAGRPRPGPGYSLQFR